MRNATQVLGSCTNQGMEQERHLSQLSNRVKKSHNF